jgi:acyl-coenzyme A thioesterase PaaI-like protein
MTIDYTALAEGLRAAVPYNRHLGLEYVSVEPGRCVVRLPDDERLRNHVGTQHASGLFSAAEAASGGAFTATFAERLGELRPLVTHAEVDFVKLARGPIDAEATLGAEAAEIERALADDGRAEFPVAVTLRDAEGVEVARMTVRWHLRSSG